MVSAGIGLFGILNCLGRDEVGRADDAVVSDELGQIDIARVRAEAPDQTEVEHLHVVGHAAAIGEENICGLDVAVD